MSALHDSASVFRHRGGRYAAGALAVLAVLALAGCEPGVLHPRGPIGAAQKTILLDSLAIMLAIVVPTMIATLAFAWWFRASNTKARYRPDWAFSGSIELVVWAIPVMVILLLGGVTWLGSYALDPAKPIEGDAEPLEIQVVSLDWKWLFIYPQQRTATINELVVPAGVPLHFTLTSGSVMNTFFVPQLGSMIYTMNGMATQLWLRADEPGTYRGMSAHYSGDGFSDMHFPVRAVSAEAFAAWTHEAPNAPALDGARYQALAQQFVQPQPLRMNLAQADLFHRIVSQAEAPGPGPGASPAPPGLQSQKSAWADDVCRSPTAPAGLSLKLAAGGN